MGPFTVLLEAQVMLAVLVRLPTVKALKPVPNTQPVLLTVLEKLAEDLEERQALRAKLLGLLACFLLPWAAMSGGAGRIVGVREHDVDVARVVQLVAAEPDYDPWRIDRHRCPTSAQNCILRWCISTNQAACHCGAAATSLPSMS
mgnify:CR=1 FL=1